MIRENKVLNLHTKAFQVAQNYKKLEGELLDLLQELDLYKVHSKFGYNSLFQYCTSYLNLSESTAYALINVARKSKQIPELKKEVQCGNISLSKAKKITSVLNSKNKEHWLKLAKTSTQAQIEKEVAKVSPERHSFSQMLYINESLEVKEKVKKEGISRVQLQVGISEGLMLKIKRAQDVLSQSSQKPVGLESTLDQVISFYLEKQDPLEKAKRHKRRSFLRDLKQKESLKQHQNLFVSRPTSQTLKQAQVPTSRSRQMQTSTSTYKESKLPPKKAKKRSSISLNTKHEVYFKAQGQCTHVGAKGQRCQETRFLDIHHIQALAQGGDHNPSNLTLLCKGHHRALHIQEG